ncbi:acid phosphatase-domain-containing protein [Dactylonectria estremocensis]|uniref:Acid phosphatase-domain-containing protein n=1 Tax=Dactylonectria estremocensis TaxID=1079267 RepID=A0A9P9FB58_9HYPO|nr:acid phosphatase-domain-containing protein [Dactylonectria estremocensis]
MPKKLSKNNSFPTSSASLSSVSTAATSTSLSHLPASLADPALPLPKLVVYDLDYTLWPFWVDTHVTPPLKPNGTHTAATDKYGEDFAFYADVPGILYALPRAGVRMAVASRTPTPNIARDLLKMIHIPPLPPADDAAPPGKPEKPKRATDVFDGGVEAYPGSKLKHFEVIQKRTGVHYEDMLFFDDEPRNFETESLGVTMYLIRDGVTWSEIEKGVLKWRTRRGYIQPPTST